MIHIVCVIVCNDLIDCHYTLLSHVFQATVATHQDAQTMPDFADAVSSACLPVQAVVGTWLFGVDHVERRKWP